MVAMSNNTPSETATPTVTVNPNNQEMNSDYEKCREERIKQNLERMQKLGIYDLSLKLKSIKPNRHKKNYKTPNHCVSPLPSSSVPTRRSLRLQNTTVVSYAEEVLPKKGKRGREILMMENSRPEVYTEEHEKMLGDCKTEWTLFVDGYGKDGKKIYDQVRGKTCHQCRQKTLGHRTHCISCDLVQGQFCGDCLYMRYGENVLEAMQNPDWICPVCRGICNCSLCRQAKGWAPTGMLYRKISSLGYKSVAHYLIQTRRFDPDSEKNEEKTETVVSAKRSLPFPREEVDSKDGAAKTEEVEEVKYKNLEAEGEFEDRIATKEVYDDERPTELESSNEDGVASNDKLEKFESEDLIATKKANEDEKSTNLELSDEPLCNNVKLENPEESKDKNPESMVNGNEVNASEVHLEIINPECSNDNRDDDVKATIVTPETKKGSLKKRQFVDLENSIAGRLRSRRKCT